MIKRNENEFKIVLPKYKINLKTVDKDKGMYQYSCILPPLLCSFFNIEDNKLTDYAKYNSLCFYTYDLQHYVMSTEDLLTAINITYPLTNEDHDRNINYEMYDKIRARHHIHTKVYRLSRSNNYRVTLPSKLFKEQVNPNKNNYIRFTIDTLKDDVLYKKGVVTYEVIQELKQ